jgi:peptide/nickel transport system ATP-binding protein
VDVILQSPQHPYTQGLIACIPSLQADPDPARPPLNEISGIVPALTDLGLGCPFSPRCAQAMPKCGEALPPLKEISADHVAACWLQES